MKLPDLKLLPAPEWQRERLDAWLGEWEISRDLAAGNAVDDECADADDSADDTATSAPLSAEPEPVAGQVRLLSPVVPVASERLVYIVVLRVSGDDMFAVAPFGRFSEPCIPGELLTERPDLSLRVLCLWNTVELSASVIRQGWVVDSLSDQELHDALRVEDCSRNGDSLPSELVERVGPPMWHPSDPRRLYMAEESSLADGLRAACEESASGTIIYPVSADQDRLVADPHADYEVAPGDEEDEDPSPDTAPDDTSEPETT